MVLVLRRDAALPLRISCLLLRVELLSSPVQCKWQDFVLISVKSECLKTGKSEEKMIQVS